MVILDSKDAVIIYVIHGVLKPERHVKNVGRPSIAESQLAAIKFIEQDVQADLYTGEPPFILIKQSIYSVEKVMVVTDQIIYNVSTVGEALSLCFKIYQVLNFMYNAKCINFWLFIQKIVFEIDLTCDIVGNSFKSLQSYINDYNIDVQNLPSGSNTATSQR